MFLKIQGFTDRKNGIYLTSIIFRPRNAENVEMTLNCEADSFIFSMKHIFTLFRFRIVFTWVLCSSCLKSIIPCLASSWKRCSRLHFSSFSHPTFRAADIMVENIFCKSTETDLCINPLSSIQPYFSHITLTLFGTTSFPFILLSLVIRL